MNPNPSQHRPVPSQPPMQQPTGPILDPSPQSKPPQPHSRSASFFGFRNRASSATEPTHRAPTRSLSALAPSQIPQQHRQGTADEFGRTPVMNIAPSAAPQNGFAAANPNLNPSLHATAHPSSQQGLGPPQPEAPMQPTQPIHPEIRSVVHLNLAHAHKVYFSGPLVRRIERQPDGQRPTKDEGWVDVWGQLGGTTLSVWDMKEIAEASKQGKEVPPTYINMTDAVRFFFLFFFFFLRHFSII